MTSIPGTILLGAGDRPALVTCEWGIVPPHQPAASHDDLSDLGLLKDVARAVRTVTKMAVLAGVPVGLNNATSGKSQGEMDTGFSLTEVWIKSLFRTGSCRYVAAKDGVGVWD